MHNINPLWHSFEASHPSDPVLSHFCPLVFFHLQSIFWLHFFKVRKGDYINLVMMNHPLSIQRSEKVEGLLLEIKSVAGWKQYITDTEGHKANHCFYTWVGWGERSKTLIVGQHFTRFVLDRLAEFISYVSLHVSSVLLSVLHSPNDAARSKVVRLPHTNQLSTTFPPSPAAALNSINLAGKVSCYGIAVQEWVTYKV